VRSLRPNAQGGITPTVILAAWLSRKINNPWLAAALGALLIGLGIYGLVNDDMPTIIAILIIVVGVINMCRLLPAALSYRRRETRRAVRREVRRATLRDPIISLPPSEQR